jgi:hypothetical protein
VVLAIGNSQRAQAQSFEGVLPPKVNAILEQVTESARKLQGEVNMPDPENQAREGKILSASGTRHLISNISGDRQVSDVLCSCGDRQGRSPWRCEEKFLAIPHPPGTAPSSKRSCPCSGRVRILEYPAPWHA